MTETLYDDLFETEGDDSESIEEKEPSSDEESKLYTEEELNQRLDDLLAKKIARREAKIRREYEAKINKLGETETVLKAGLGVDTLDEALADLKDYYSGKGIEIPESTFANGLSEKDMIALGKADAKEIITSGVDEVIEEVDRLAEIGYNNLSSREKALFMELAEVRKSYEKEKQFKEMGIPEETYKSVEFEAFAKKFAENVPVSEIVELFDKKNLASPKKQTIGSMTTPPTAKVKEYYTSEEVDKLTLQDLSNPQIMEAVTRSMAKW